MSDDIVERIKNGPTETNFRSADTENAYTSSWWEDIAVESGETIDKLRAENDELKKSNEWVNVKIAELPKPNTAVYVRTESGLEFYAYWQEVKIGSLISGYWYCKNKDYPESWTEGDCIGDLANGIKVDQVTHVNFNK